MRAMSKEPAQPKDPTAPRLSLGKVLGYLWPYLWEFRGRVLLALLALLAAKGATLAMPWALKHIIDGVDRNLQPELVLPIAFLLLYGCFRFGGVFFGELRDALFSRVTERAMRRIGLRVFEHLHQMELNFHLSRQTGGISRDIERRTRGVNFLMRFMLFNIVPLLFVILMFTVLFSFAFYIWYAIIILIAVLIFVGFTLVVTEWRKLFVSAANP